MVALLRRLGLRLIIYLDNIILFNQTQEGVLRDRDSTLWLLQHLGFVMNWKKSVLIPSHCLEYLGFVINSLEIKLSLPREKTHQVLQKPDLGKDCLGQNTSKTCWETDFISAGSSPCTRALKTLANIASARPASREGLQSNSSAQSELPEGRPMVGGSNFHLEWSVDNYPSSRSDNNRDASTQGWGAVCQGGHTRGPWTQQESNSPHINVLVLKAALFAVRAFTAKQKQLHLHLRMDNKGGDTILSDGRDNPRIVGLCSEQRNYSDSRISAWRIQSQGRLAVQTIGN